MGLNLIALANESFSYISSNKGPGLDSYGNPCCNTYQIPNAWRGTAIVQSQAWKRNADEVFKLVQRVYMPYLGIICRLNTQLTCCRSICY